MNTPCAEHARSYLDTAPTQPHPMVDPMVVAEAILRAASEGGGDVKIEERSLPNGAPAPRVPAMGDTIATRQVREWPGNDPMHTADGTLYVAGNSGRTHGRATP